MKKKVYIKPKVAIVGIDTPCIMLGNSGCDKESISIGTYSDEESEDEGPTKDKDGSWWVGD